MPTPTSNYDDTKKVANDLRRLAVERLNTDFAEAPRVSEEGKGEDRASPEECHTQNVRASVTTISGWWIPLGVAISVGAGHFNLKWQGYRSEHLYFIAIPLMLSAFVLVRLLARKGLGQNGYESAYSAIVITLLIILGWSFGDFLIVFIARIR
jgi:hypothetical protein